MEKYNLNMKLIITEEQLRMIIENEDKGKNLLNFTPFIVSPVNQWDMMFLHINRKRGGKYDGYYIDGDLDLSGSDVTELNYLVKVSGYLDLLESQIESLDNLVEVGDFLDLKGSQIKSLDSLVKVDSDLGLFNTPIESLDRLEYVGGKLDLRDSQIKSLDRLEYVGEYLDLRRTPLSKTTTEEELRKQINVGGNIYL